MGSINSIKKIVKLINNNKNKLNRKMIFIFHFDSNNARRLLFILVNQIITVQSSLLYPPKIETLVHSVTQNSIKRTTHILNKNGAEAEN